MFEKVRDHVRVFCVRGVQRLDVRQHDEAEVAEPLRLILVMGSTGNQVLLDLPRGPKHSLRVYDFQLRDNVRGLRREAAARRPYSFERGHDLLVCFRVERVVVVRF